MDGGRERIGIEREAVGPVVAGVQNTAREAGRRVDARDVVVRRATGDARVLSEHLPEARREGGGRVGVGRFEEGHLPSDALAVGARMWGALAQFAMATGRGWSLVVLGRQTFGACGGVAVRRRGKGVGARRHGLSLGLRRSVFIDDGQPATRDGSGREAGSDW